VRVGREEQDPEEAGESESETEVRWCRRDNVLRIGGGEVEAERGQVPIATMCLYGTP